MGRQGRGGGGGELGRGEGWKGRETGARRLAGRGAGNGARRGTGARTRAQAV